MTGLIQRNLKIYFEDKSGVFFSLMGAMISFVLYLIFLSHNMEQNWRGIPDTKLLLDPWLIGGTMTITAITTTLSSLSLMVQDREKNILADLSLTDQSYLKIQSAYLFTAMLIGTIMQLVMYFMMGIYFSIVDQSPMNFQLFSQILGLAILSSFIWTMFNLLLLSFAKKVDTLGKIATIVGTAAGFLAGVYIPIGILPKAVQKVMEYTPALYNTAMYRHILMNKQLQISFKNMPQKMNEHFTELMGINVHLGNRILTMQQDLLIVLGFVIVISVITFLFASISRRNVISKV